MPEGDTVWNTARLLERALAGQVLTGSEFRVPALATADLTGWRVAESASRRWTQSTTGSLRRGETSYVYGRRAQPCRRCGTAVAKAEQGERVTYWCPTCQPGPA